MGGIQIQYAKQYEAPCRALAEVRLLTRERAEVEWVRLAHPRRQFCVVPQRVAGVGVNKNPVHIS